MTSSRLDAAAVASRKLPVGTYFDLFSDISSVFPALTMIIVETALLSEFHVVSDVKLLSFSHLSPTGIYTILFIPLVYFFVYVASLRRIVMFTGVTMSQAKKTAVKV